MPHIVWHAQRYPSWIRGVSLDGITTAWSAISIILPPSPVKDIVMAPRSFAASIARMTFLELPDVDMPMTTSPFLQMPSICLLKTRS